MINKYNYQEVPLKIYVAGPYTPRDCSLHDAARIAQRNTNRAIEIGNALMAKGHFVFVPHLTHYLHIHESCTVSDSKWWYDLDNSFLQEWANALFYFAPSWGADEERKWAEEHNLEVFTKLDHVPFVFQPCYASCGNSKEGSFEFHCVNPWHDYSRCTHKQRTLSVMLKNSKENKTE
jgi:hypothetical protein